MTHRGFCRTSLAALIGTISALAFASACRDARLPTSPASTVRPITRLPGVPLRSTSSLEGSGPVATFTVTPAGGVYTLGDARITIPAGVICDVETSGYGPDYWDTPCAPETDTVVLTVRVLNDHGLPRLVVSPNMRFMPSTDSTKWVHFGLPVNEAPGRTLLWVPDGLGMGYDEARVDSTMTGDLTAGGTRRRWRLKHFSGYQVAMGYTDQPSDSTGT